MKLKVSFLFLSSHAHAQWINGIFPGEHRLASYLLYPEG